MTTNPWDRPPILEKGDRIRNSTYRSVGLALSNWEFYEFALGLIFRCVANADWDGPVDHAYGSIITHKGRVEMIQATAKVYFKRHPTGPRKELTAVLDKAGKLCARRNEIAHGRVQRFEKRPGWYLLPSHFAINKHELLGVVEGTPSKFGPGRAKTKRRPLYAYTSKQITGMATAFWDLGQEAAEIPPMLIHARITDRVRKMSETQPELLQVWLEHSTRKSRNSRPAS